MSESASAGAPLCGFAALRRCWPRPRNRRIERFRHKFSGDFYLPLETLDLISDQPLTVNMRMALRVAGADRILVRSEPKTVTLSKDEVPRIRTSEDRVSVRTDERGEEYLVWKGNIHSRSLESRQVVIEFVVRTSDGRRIEVRDAKYRGGDGEAAAGKTLRPTRPNSVFRDRTIELPMSALVLHLQPNTLTYQVRARVDGRYVWLPLPRSFEVPRNKQPGNDFFRN